MKIGNGLAIFVSVLFFFELAGAFALGVSILFPGFTFSENPIIRLIFLAIFIYITKLFYNYLLNKSDEEESENNEVNSESSDLNRKIAVVGVVGIFIAFIALFIFMNSTVLFGLDDVDNPLSFSDSNISFKYPGNWERQYTTSSYLVLIGNGLVFDLYYNSTNGNSIDNITDDFVSDFSNSSTTLLFKNVTNIDGKKAYDIGFKLDNANAYSRLLIFEDGNNYYIYTFTVNNLDKIGPGFGLIKNTTKIG